MEPSQLSEIAIKLDALKNHIDGLSNPYWPAVIAGGFAVFAAMFSGQAMEFTKHQRQRLAIRTALIAEVRAIKKIAVSRDYLNMLRELEENPGPIHISIPSITT